MAKLYDQSCNLYKVYLNCIILHFCLRAVGKQPEVGWLELDEKRKY